MSLIRPIALCALLATLAWSAVAHATVCPQSAAVRINVAEFPRLLGVVRSTLPPQINLPELNYPLLNWPLTSADATLATDPMPASLWLKDLQLGMQGDALHITLRADLSTRGLVRIDNAFVGFGSLQCDLAADLREVTVDLVVRLAQRGGAASAEVLAAAVSLDQPNSRLELQNCTLGQLAQTVLSYLQTNLVEVARQQLEQFARNDLANLVLTQLYGSVTQQGVYRNLAYQLVLAGATTDPNGLTLFLNAGVDPLTLAPGVPACAVPALQATPPGCDAGVVPELRHDLVGTNGVSVSANLLNQALYAVWKNGQLCLDSRSLISGTLHATLQQLMQSYADFFTTAGTSIDFQIGAQVPPRVAFDGQGMTLQFSDLLVLINLRPPGGRVDTAQLSLDLSVRTNPTVDPATSTIQLALSDATISRLKSMAGDQTGSQAEVDPARLERFITNGLLPLLNEQLQRSLLLPTIWQFSPYLVEVTQSEIGLGYLAIYFTLYEQSTWSNDTVPPETQLLTTIPPVVGPGVLSVNVGGQDNETPTNLLRFQWRQGAGPWQTAQFGRLIHLGVPGDPTLMGNVMGPIPSSEQIQIAAVDLAGNVDPTPAQFVVEIDGQPPVLQLGHQPKPIDSRRDIAVAFSATDDRTAAADLVYRIVLLRTVDDDAGLPLPVATIPAEGTSPDGFAPGLSTAVFNALPDGIYKIRITVRDHAGNVTSTDIGFAVQENYGCQQAQPQPALWWWLIGLVGLPLARRRRR